VANSAGVPVFEVVAGVMLVELAASQDPKRL
jgi:hypothetical protein